MKSAYLEPFSYYGHGMSGDGSMNKALGRTWDGKSEQKNFGRESEILLQRGTKFRITKAEYTGGTLYLDLEIVEQNVLPFPYSGGYPFK